MALPPMPDVYGMPWETFHTNCLLMARLTAEDIRYYLAHGGVVEVDRKDSYAGIAGADVVTTVDKRAQAMLTKLAGRLLPTQIGWIAEEDGLRRSATGRHRVTITFDPVDGTGRLVWLNQHGHQPGSDDISVMIGVQFNGAAVGGYICDVATGIIYYRQPYAPTVNLMGPDGSVADLAGMRQPGLLSAGTLLWHGKRNPSGNLTKILMDTAFAHFQRGRCSIGLTVVGVFTGKWAAVLRPAGSSSTPWDDTPLGAMVAQGDVAMLRVNGKRLEETRFGDLGRNVECPYDLLYVPRANIRELRRRVPVDLLF